MGFLEERAGLAGKVAVIMGGGGGLGRAVAVDFARAGMPLALCDRNEELLGQTAAQAEALGSTVLAQTLDVRSPEAVTAFFEHSAQLHGRLDVLVNVAGGTFRQPFAESGPKGWEALVQTNFLWLLHATQLAIAQMRAGQRGGSIISITSIEAHRAAPGFAVYAAMKAAVTNFSRSLALELAPEHIRCNTIAPDMIPTEAIEAIAATASGDSGLAWPVAIPLQRVGRYEDAGNAALFLASELSNYLTGEVLHLDGGAHASSGWFNWPGTGWSPVPPQAAVAPLLGPDAN